MADLNNSTFLRQQVRTVYGPNNVVYDDFIRLRAVRIGKDLPQFRSLIVKGVNATTPLDAFTESAEISAGRWELNFKGAPHAFSTRCGINMGITPLTIPASLVKDAESIATGKAYAQINRLLSSFSGQVFLGEMKETISLLRNPLAQSAALARSLVKRKEVSKNIGSSWLEFQFGFMPLLSDIDALTKLLTGQLKKQSSLSYRSYGKVQGPVTTSVQTGALDYNLVTNSVNTTESVSAECALHYGISQKWLESATGIRSDFASQFNQLSSVPVTAWELVPWSFLVDYFTNVSDIIEASFTSTAGVTYVSRSSIGTHEVTRVGLAVNGPGGDYVLVHATPRVFRYKKRNVLRVNTTLGIPSLVFSLPGSNIKYLNIAALIASLTL